MKKIFKKIRNKIFRKYQQEVIHKIRYDERYIYREQAGSDIIFKKLKEGKPCLIARCGGTEMRTLNYFLKKKKKYLNINFLDNHKYMMNALSGFFPADNDMLTRFCSEYIQAIKNVDVMAVWFNEGEEYVCKIYCPEAKLIGLEAIGDYIGLLKRPWTKYLKGKKVLVIHPFEKTIINQYKKRELLFKNPETLPEFELKTLKSVQSLGATKGDLGYESWFDALDDMCNKIDSIDFDIALIGAGAYGMFLGEYCKKIGKQAVHVGGALQLLFGIKGKRWVEGYDKSFGEKLFNDNWVYPSQEDQIKQQEAVEGACYW